MKQENNNNNNNNNNSNNNDNTGKVIKILLAVIVLLLVLNLFIPLFINFLSTDGNNAVLESEIENIYEEIPREFSEEEEKLRSNKDYPIIIEEIAHGSIATTSGEFTSYFTNDDIKDINVFAIDGDIIIKEVRGESNKIIVNIKSDNLENYSIYESNKNNNEINIEYKASVLNKISKKDEIYITLEKEYSEKYEIGNLKLTTISGNIKLSSFIAESINVTNTSGKIELDNITVKSDLKISNTSGKILLKNILAQEYTEIKNISGSNEIINSDLKNLEMSSVSGKQNLQGISVNDLDINSISGSIDINILKIKDELDLKIKTTSSNANLKLPKDSKLKFSLTKKIKTKIVSDKNSSNELEFKTTSGTLNID